MDQSRSSIIIGSGHYIPNYVIRNQDFLKHTFYTPEGVQLPNENADVIEKFYQITGIEERRVLEEEWVTSDMAFFAAEKAILQAGVDKESLDYIIVAHNFGDVKEGNRQVDTVPSLAARVKHKLQIHNPYTVAYDLPFGCPGWLQALIQAHYYLQSGDAKRILVIGAETLSRVSDPNDRDSMIYSDGAGAVVLEARNAKSKEGVLAHISRSDTLKEAHLLWMGQSNHPEADDQRLFLKMEGRKLYEYALNTVPKVMKDCLDKAGLDIAAIKKVIIHQANTKMDEAMLSRLFKLYDHSEIPEGIMPMTIAKFGNNSVATLPVLFDLLMREQLEGYRLLPGDYLIFASVGAGMNANALVYKMPE